MHASLLFKGLPRPLIPLASRKRCSSQQCLNMKSRRQSSSNQETQTRLCCIRQPLTSPKTSLEIKTSQQSCQASMTRLRLLKQLTILTSSILKNLTKKGNKCGKQFTPNNKRRSRSIKEKSRNSKANLLDREKRTSRLLRTSPNYARTLNLEEWMKLRISRVRSRSCSHN